MRVSNARDRSHESIKRANSPAASTLFSADGSIAPDRGGRTLAKTVGENRNFIAGLPCDSPHKLDFAAYPETLASGAEEAALPQNASRGCCCLKKSLDQAARGYTDCPMLANPASI